MVIALGVGLGIVIGVCLLAIALGCTEKVSFRLELLVLLTGSWITESVIFVKLPELYLTL